MNPTRTIELRHGYMDAEGRAHTRATLRPSTMDDLIKAEAMLTQMRLGTEQQKAESRSDMLLELAMLQQCMLSLGDIPRVELKHLRALRRRDAMQLLEALAQLDAELEQDEGNGDA